MRTLLKDRHALIIALAAAGILMVTMGSRQSFGLFIAPLNDSTGLGIATISLALAIGQFTWGAIQPIAGAFADRHGAHRVLQIGLILLALGCALTPFMASSFGLMVSLGLLSAMGSGIGSFSVLIGAAARGIPSRMQGPAAGLINAGGSFGQFVFAPVTQKLIQMVGWMGAIWAMAIMVLAALPLISRLTRPIPRPISNPISKPVSGEASNPLPEAQPPAASPTPTEPEGGGAWPALCTALKTPSYLLLLAGFFTCGFHIAFLVTHLPGEVNLCGLPASVSSWSLAIIGLANIFGSLYAGSCIAQYRSKYILAVMYGSRALLIIGYLLAPRTALTFYIFAAGLGFTWLATVPPTAAIVGKLFGTRYLATLFGFTLLSHQIGGFLGAWLGGLSITRFGDFTWMWYADITLSALAALVHLPIREARIPREQETAAAPA